MWLTVSGYSLHPCREFNVAGPSSRQLYYVHRREQTAENECMHLSVLLAFSTLQQSGLLCPEPDAPENEKHLPISLRSSI